MANVPKHNWDLRKPSIFFLMSFLISVSYSHDVEQENSEFEVLS